MQAQDFMDSFWFCQKSWTYLLNIFQGPDIKKKLQDESKAFERVDAWFKGEMKKASTTLRKIDRFLFKNQSPNWVAKQLDINKRSLNDIQRKLENYLDVKRQAFPRFYFLSNDELLEILAQASDMTYLQRHIKKCFDNVASFELDAGT